LNTDGELVREFYLDSINANKMYRGRDRDAGDSVSVDPMG
jgi:hypothetical protein